MKKQEKKPQENQKLDKIKELGPLPDGRAAVIRINENQISLGVVHSTTSEPPENAELISYSEPDEFGWSNVESHGPCKGPAMVNGSKFRDGWDRIFSMKRGKQNSLPN